MTEAKVAAAAAIEEVLEKTIKDLEVLQLATENQPRQVAALKLSTTAIITSIRGLEEYKALCENEKQRALQASQLSSEAD